MPRDAASKPPPDAVPEALFDTFPPTSTDDWKRAVEDDLNAPLDTLTWEAPGGLRLRPFYRAEDLEALASTGPAFAEAPWQLRHDVAAPNLDDARQHVQDALEGGAQALGLVLGEGGLPVASADDLEAVLDGVDLRETPLHLRGGAAAWAMLRDVAERRGVERAALRGSVDLDPVSRLARGRLPDADAAFDEAAEAVQAAGDAPMRLLRASATPAHEAGATEVQELAFALAAASEHLAQSTARGLAPIRVAKTLHVELPVGISYFLEIAKARALRHCWPQVVGAFTESDAVPASFVQAVTSRRMLTLYDPHMNLLRGTTAAAAAVLGGADVVAVRPFDAAGGTPSSSFAQRLARGTQHVLHHEAHFDHVTDPAAGSYYLETLTDKLARAAWQQFQSIEAEGGLLVALKSGFVQEQIAESRETRRKAFATRERVLVGTTHYPNPDETRLANAPDRRTASDEPAEHAVELLPSIRDAEPFEALRLRTERWAETHGAPPLVTLLPVGDPSVRSARATFARNVFGCAGFRIEEPLGFDDAEEAAQAAASSEAAIVVLCSHDDSYADLLPRVRQRCADLDDAPLLVIAGAPADDLAPDGFVHRGMNVLGALEDYQNAIGIP